MVENKALDYVMLDITERVFMHRGYISEILDTMKILYGAKDLHILTIKILTCTM